MLIKLENTIPDLDSSQKNERKIGIFPNWYNYTSNWYLHNIFQLKKIFKILYTLGTTTIGLKHSQIWNDRV